MGDLLQRKGTAFSQSERRSRRSMLDANLLFWTRLLLEEGDGGLLFTVPEYTTARRKPLSLRRNRC